MAMEGESRTTKKATISQDLKRVSFDIPDDLIIEILSKLPLKSLFRSQSVCKTWYALTKTPYFLSKHQTSSTLNPHPLFFFTVGNSRKKIMSFRCCERFDYSIRVHFPLLSTRHIVGVSCGLVLATDYCGGNSIICNPFTKQFRFFCWPFKLVKRDVVDFLGFGVLGNSQNIVRVLCFTNSNGEIVVRAELYTIVTDGGMYKEIDVRIREGADLLALMNLCGCRYAKPRKPVFKNGIFYWEAEMSRDACVVSFDISHGVFDVIATPFDANLVRWELREIKGDVSVAIYHGDRWFELFVLDEKKRSWSVTYEVANIPVFGYAGARVSVLGCTKNNELILEDWFEKHVSLLLLDLNSKGIKHLYDSGVSVDGFEAYLSSESLVSVDNKE